MFRNAIISRSNTPKTGFWSRVLLLLNAEKREQLQYHHVLCPFSHKYCNTQLSRVLESGWFFSSILRVLVWWLRIKLRICLFPRYEYFYFQASYLLVPCFNEISTCSFKKLTVKTGSLQWPTPTILRFTFSFKRFIRLHATNWFKRMGTMLLFSNWWLVQIIGTTHATFTGDLCL